MRSMFSAVSGLGAHQARMDVIGNNIANVNTVGFKGSRATFAETFNQTIRGASAGNEGRGGTNPMQVGLGANLATMEVNHNRGAIERTDIPTDLMINGDGFFIVSDDPNFANRHYTRAGNFTVDKSGNVLTPDGYRVLGYNIVPETIGQENPTYENELKGLVIPTSTVFPPKGTGKSHDGTGGDTGDFPSLTSPDDVGVWFTGNLNADCKIPTNYNDGSENPPTGIDNIIVAGNELSKIEPQEAIARDTTFTVFDELGGRHEIRIAFIKAAPNEWKVCIIDNDGKIQGNPHDLEFNPNTGKIKKGKELDLEVYADANNLEQKLPNGASPFIFRMDLSEITQYENDSDVYAKSVVGYQSGSFESFTIGTNGVITVRYSNGMDSPAGRIGLAKFANPAGLLKTQGNLFDVSPNSGTPIIGKPMEAGFADLSPGSLEMSNVDLAREFTNMITTQRGFQANSKIITTTDEMLQELVNMKR